MLRASFGFLVPSLSQPSGNITGMAVFNATLAEKRIELMKELIPTVGVIGYLLNPSGPDVGDRIEGRTRSSARIGNRTSGL